jgi:hypothetical protein
VEYGCVEENTEIEILDGEVVKKIKIKQLYDECEFIGL